MAKSASQLLINEPPLQVLPTLAKLIGLNEALVLQQLHYWQSHEKIGITRNGKKWVYNSYAEWQGNFPFWSRCTIQRIFSKLESKKLILSLQANKDKGDKTKSYRIDYDALERLSRK